jgi:2'-5' RNA ligase
MTEQRRVRAFLALDLPREIRAKIEIIQGQLKPLLRGDIRWTNPDNVHLTIKFFGLISRPQIATIFEVVGGITARTKSPALQVGSVEVFPSTKRPRVIWLSIQGEVEPLTWLQREIDEKLLGCGFEAEERPFRPHLTLGRIKGFSGSAGLDDIVARGDAFAAGSFAARELTLFKSELTPQGAIYTALAICPFAK